MFYKRLSIVIPIIIVASALFAGKVVLAATGVTARVSVSSSGAQGNQSVTESDPPAISADGRYVVFDSYASNMVAGDTNNSGDVFLRDRQTNTTTRISLASDGTQANDESYLPAISPDGRYVVFASKATNLVIGDTNLASDIFLHDMQTNITTRISLASDGTQANNSSFAPDISANGRYVVFRSLASNLVSGSPVSGIDQIFLRDKQTNTTTHISISSNGTLGNNNSFSPAISADGRYITYYSDASNLVAGDTNGQLDIFLRDTQTNTTTRLSLALNGQQANQSSYFPDISANGRYVVFLSDATNLVVGDTNGLADIFLRDMRTNTTTRLSVAPDGAQGNSFSTGSSISNDGRYVAFASHANNLVVGDTNTIDDIFVRDMLTNVTIRLSLSSNGTQANNDSLYPIISGNGNYVVFQSYANNLVNGDTNGFTDVFVREVGDIPTPTPKPKSAALPATGFAAGRISNLPQQPAAKGYTDQGMSLEISSLNLKSTIVGVPKDGDGGWDLSWLGSNIGYLSGTAFPTWAGNSVLTGHIYDANGQPGPFIHLNRMGWGQQIIIHAWGQQYIYTARSVDGWVDPMNTNALTKHEDYPWLTLITCQGYDDKTDSYRWRTIVRAVLVKILDAP
jgi:LPXTG-site transpeptidase (sortase) family protein